MGLSREDFARKFEVTLGAVYLWENDLRQPRGRNKRLLAAMQAKIAEKKGDGRIETKPTDDK